ncbi:MAG: hydrogenase maturation nickel metallochaperone HypA [Sedimentisphaerales bacterium]|nr:hydrogenase maturation nickel metallochaperone HypA [Sedimentisphaerales bacterium]
MHEMTIAEALIKQVLNLAEQNNAEKVCEVEVSLGVMRLVVPEALDVAFAALAEGTIAQGAVLNQVEKPITARCRQCSVEYQPPLGDMQCPQCHQADFIIIDGDEIILKSLVCDTKEGATQQ